MFLFYLLTSLFVRASNEKHIESLRELLTSKESKIWFDNMTEHEESGNPYCNLCCINMQLTTVGKRCGEHTMCSYPENKTGDACKGYIAVGFTLPEKQVLVDAHNTIRNLVASGGENRGNPGPQPSAANMRELEWDEELATVAERWAAQCIYSNDICRDLERFPVGQNIAQGNLATSNELSFIKQWYDEVHFFDKSEAGHFKLPKSGMHAAARYTQLVWADTYQIGCARAIFQESTGSVVTYREHLICNYGPTGNIPMQPVYAVGAPCSACHKGTRCTLNYPSLCKGHTINQLMDDAYKSNSTLLNDSKKTGQLTEHNETSGACKSGLECLSLIVCFYIILYTYILLSKAHV